MANRRIGELPEIDSVSASDVVHVSQGGLDRSIRFQDFVKDLDAASNLATVYRDVVGSINLNRDDLNSFIRLTDDLGSDIIVTLEEDTWEVGDRISFYSESGVDLFLQNSSTVDFDTALSPQGGSPNVFLIPEPNSLVTIVRATESQWFVSSTNLGGGLPSFADGSDEFPSITFSSDLTTGFYHEPNFPGSIFYATSEQGVLSDGSRDVISAFTPDSFRVLSPRFSNGDQGYGALLRTRSGGITFDITSRGLGGTVLLNRGESNAQAISIQDATSSTSILYNLSRGSINNIPDGDLTLPTGGFPEVWTSLHSISATGQHRAPPGNFIRPTWSFLDAVESGMYHSGGEEVTIAVSREDSVTFTDTGIELHGGEIRDVADIFLDTNLDTTAATANLAMDAGTGRIVRSVSTARSKNTIEPVTEELGEKVLEMIPVTYFANNEGDDKQYLGFTAEQLDDIGAHQLVVYKEYDPEVGPIPESVNYDRVCTLLVEKVKRQQKQIDSLEERLSALEDSLS